MSQLVCKNLIIGYEDGPVAPPINVTIESGDYFCIVGENGSGKTTFMKTLLGLIAPLGGEILRGNEFAPGKIGYLPQLTSVQRDFPASVMEIVLSGTILREGRSPFYSKGQKSLAQEKMKKLGIENLAYKNYRNLSGGQQQRVLLARALCSAEKILLLDEPTAGLDHSATEEMYNHIKALNDEGMTIIMITHDAEAAFKYGKAVFNMGKEIVINE